jgi:hypothetical protein
MKYKDKDLESIRILNPGNEGTLTLCEYDQRNISFIKYHPATLDKGKNTQNDKGINDPKVRMEYFHTGRLVLMWDKRKGEPNICKEFDCLWYGPYKIKKKSEPSFFYLSTPEGKRLPLPFNGSLFKPFYTEGTWLLRIRV